jgi:Sucrase/ferredoxin-like
VDELTPCSDLSRALAEPLCGTASRVRAWLLIEQPGEWGRDAVLSGTLGPKLGRRLKEGTAPHGIRVVALRKPGGRVASDPPACYLAFSGMDDRWVLRLDIGSVHDLLDIDFAPIASGERPLFGTEHEKPVYLVCTHGTHDPCCGRLGPAIAATLADHRPDSSWECSHIGGDRFAANIVCLPHGLYFGRVSDPQLTIDLYERGLIDLDHYRGRSCYVPTVQAAEVMLRAREGIEGIDELTPTGRVDHGGGDETVSFDTPSGEELSIRICVQRAMKRRLTCDATNPGRPRCFVTVDAMKDPVE